MFVEASSNMFSFLENVKANLVAQSEGISLEQARTFNVTQLHNPNSIALVNEHFVNATGAYSLEALMTNIESYNQQLIKNFPHNDEKQIAVEKLQLEETTLAIILQQLTQIQLHVVSSENSYLNFALANK
jgi:hypothetical protein